MTGVVWAPAYVGALRPRMAFRLFELVRGSAPRSGNFWDFGPRKRTFL